MNGFEKATSIVEKTTGIIEKASTIPGKLFPYLGIKKDAVESYKRDIMNSNLSPDHKAIALRDLKKHMKYLKNQESIAVFARLNANANTDFSENSKVDDDWLDRFMDSAKFVSKERVQLLWGRILAKEFEKPGSAPLNVIRVLSEITPELATAFSVLSKMVVRLMQLSEKGKPMDLIPTILVPYDPDDGYLRSKGLGLETLNELESLGLISTEFLSGYSNGQFVSEHALLIIGRQLYYVESYPEGAFPVGKVLLTKTGYYFLDLVESGDIDGYAEHVIKYLKRSKVVFKDNHRYIMIVEGDQFKIGYETEDE